MDSAGQSLSHKIIKNTLYNAGSRFLGILIAIFMSPYIIHRIGPDRFGIWAIIGTVTGYFGLLGFGVETAFVKYVSEYYAKKEYDQINRVVNTGFIFFTVVMIIVLGLMVVFIRPIIAFLNVSSVPHDEVIFAFWTGAVVFCVSNALGPFTAIQNGLQRMDIFNKVTMAMSVLSAFCTVMFLEKGYGLRGLVITNALVFSCSSVVNLVIAFRILPELRFNPMLFTANALRRLFGYGYKLQISRFANLVSFETDSLLISHFLGIGLVAYYQLGTSVIQQVRQMVLLLISALVPAVSEMSATNDVSKLEELFVRGSRYLISLSIPLTIFSIINATLIMVTWMGQGYAQSALVIQVLSVGYCTATVTGVASSIAAGIAVTDLDMKFGILMASMNLILSIALIKMLGFIGVMIGTSVSLAVSSLYFMFIFHKRLGIGSMKRYVLLFYKPILSCVLPTGIVLINNAVLQNGNIAADRIVNAIYLVINCIIFAGGYGAGILRAGYFDAYDTGLLCNKIPFLKRLLNYAN
jgi:O-antigen/teichoic acid export membrane protein